MIQRIQSIYLLLATIALAGALFLPTGHFISQEGSACAFKALGVATGEGTLLSTWGLFGLLALSAIITVCTIFLFRNRRLQMRMTVFNSVLLIGYHVAYVIFLSVLKNELQSASFQLGWALCLPLVAIILNGMAFYAIKRDDEMVKAADRIR